jgi:L-lactate dehydrogenase (cytochrome)
MADFIDSSLNWKDIAWLRKATKMPIVLKGVQTAEDALLAVEHGVDGLLIGNHGGRSLDTSTPSIMILLELRKRCPEIFERIDIFMDGGIRRGTDMFKALCLGAKAVGMGRHFMYAASYGEEGVSHLIDRKWSHDPLRNWNSHEWTMNDETDLMCVVMRDEFETTMKIMGCTSLSQLHPGLLNLYDVDHWFSESSSPQRGVLSLRPIASKL